MPPLSRFKRFDVAQVLERGEDPRPEIMRRVHALAPEEGLLLNAPFLPSPLIEMLGGMGYATKLEPGTGGSWHVYIWQKESIQ